MRNLFVDYFVFPALMAGALYEGDYPLATALGRPLIAQRMVHVAQEHGATAVAHGCTGKGNDQVRFDVTFQTLAPELKIIAPVREWKWTRTRGAGVRPQARDRPGSGLGEGSSAPTRTSGAARSKPACWKIPGSSRPQRRLSGRPIPEKAPDKPAELSRSASRRASRSRSTASDMDGVAAHPASSTDLGGQHGVGRIDHVENRLVGIKSREIYEAPAAIILHEAHRELEFLTLSKDAHRFKTQISQAYSDMIYNGLWFSALHQDLMAFVASNQQYVTGDGAGEALQGPLLDRGPEERSSACTATNWRPTRRATSTTPRPRRASSRSTA